MIHPNIEAMALEYVQDIVSSGVKDGEVKKALKDNLGLDEEEVEEVWGKWQAERQSTE